MKIIFFLIALLTTRAVYADNNDLQIVTEVFQGFVNGLGKEINTKDIGTCIKDSDAIYLDFSNAIQDFEKNTAGSIFDGLEQICLALKALPSTLKDCKLAEGDAEAIEKAIEAFGSPMTFFYDLAKHIMMNNREITTEIQSAIKAWKSQDWTNFGFYVGEAVGVAVFGNSALTVTVTSRDLPGIFEGLLEGVGCQTGYPEISKCIDLSGDVAQNITTAAAEIETRQYQNVLQGIMRLAWTVEVIPDAIQLCKGAEDDAKRLYEALEVFKNPASFIYNAGKNVIINGFDILHDLNNASANYQSQDWFWYGHDLGEILALAVWGKNTTMAQAGNIKDDILLFARGFLGGIGEKEHWDQIKDCLNISDSEALLLDEAFMNFTKNTPQSVLAGLIALGNAAQMIPDAAQTCKVIVEDIDKLRRAIQAFQSPASFLYHIGVSLLLNNKEIYHEISSAVTHYKVKDWYFVGFYSGEAIADIMLGSSQDLSPRFADFLNQRAGWTAVIPDEFKGKTVDQISGEYFKFDFRICERVVDFDYTNMVADIPMSFDSRTLWPGYVPFTSSPQKVADCVNLMNPTSIQFDLMAHGIVDATMKVFEDFLYYSRGIYTHISGAFVGIHSVKIVGWGEENGVKYWIAANGWSTTWGEEGFFRIAFRECDIDSNAMSGQENLEIVNV